MYVFLKINQPLIHLPHLGHVASPSTTFPPNEEIYDHSPHFGHGTGIKNPIVFPNVTKISFITSIKLPLNLIPLTLISMLLSLINN